MLFNYYCPCKLQQFITNFYGLRSIINNIDVILHELVNTDDKLSHFEFDKILLISMQDTILCGGQFWLARDLPCEAIFLAKI